MCRPSWITIVKGGATQCCWTKCWITHVSLLTTPTTTFNASRFGMLSVMQLVIERGSRFSITGGRLEWWLSGEKQVCTWDCYWFDRSLTFFADDDCQRWSGSYEEFFWYSNPRLKEAWLILRRSVIWVLSGTRLKACYDPNIRHCPPNATRRGHHCIMPHLFGFKIFVVECQDMVITPPLEWVVRVCGSLGEYGVQHSHFISRRALDLSPPLSTLTFSSQIYCITAISFWCLPTGLRGKDYC